MLSDKLQTIIGEDSETISNSHCREYKEFSGRLANLSSNGVVTVDSFIEACNADGDDRISLCTFERTLDRIRENNLVKKILSCIRYLVLVFRRPKSHLKEIREVLPVEVVKRVGGESIRHLSSHSEHWESIRVAGLIPARLLARSLSEVIRNHYAS